MALAWVAQRRTGNSGWVDTIWTFSVGLVGAAGRGLSNLRVMTADLNVFAPEARFDRIVSVEMFEP